MFHAFLFGLAFFGSQIYVDAQLEKWQNRSTSGMFEDVQTALNENNKQNRFLHEGFMTVDKFALRSGLLTQGVIVGHTTIDAFFVCWVDGLGINENGTLVMKEVYHTKKYPPGNTVSTVLELVKKHEEKGLGEHKPPLENPELKPLSDYY